MKPMLTGPAVSCVVNFSPHFTSCNIGINLSTVILGSFESRPQIDDDDLRKLKETLSKILGDESEGLNKEASISRNQSCKLFQTVMDPV